MMLQAWCVWRLPARDAAWIVENVRRQSTGALAHVWREEMSPGCEAAMAVAVGVAVLLGLTR